MLEFRNIFGQQVWFKSPPAHLNFAKNKIAKECWRLSTMRSWPYRRSSAPDRPELVRDPRCRDQSGRRRRAGQGKRRCRAVERHGLTMAGRAAAIVDIWPVRLSRRSATTAIDHNAVPRRGGCGVIEAYGKQVQTFSRGGAIYRFQRWFPQGTPSASALRCCSIRFISVASKRWGASLARRR